MKQPSVAGRFERVLVVDDNDALRRALVRLIAGWGAQVAAAGSLKAASELLEPAPDLIVADVRLPDGNARTLFEHALRLDRPPLLLAISGRASACEGFELAQMGVHGFLEKPFDLTAVERAVQRAMAYEQASCARRELPSAANRVELELNALARRKSLSAQQVQLLRHLLHGTPRKQLPRALGVSENTCKTAIRRLLARCGAPRLSDVLREVMARSSEPATERARSGAPGHA